MSIEKINQSKMAITQSSNSNSAQSDNNNGSSFNINDFMASMTQVLNMRSQPQNGNDSQKQGLQAKLNSLDAQIKAKTAERLKAGEVYDNFYRDPAAAWGAEGKKPSQDLNKAKIELAQLEAERAEVKQELDSLSNNPFGGFMNLFNRQDS